jgi:hypothetical protein
MANPTPSDDEDPPIIVIINKAKAAALKVWAHPIGRPLVYVTLGFILGAAFL